MGSFFAGGRWRDWGLGLSAEGFHTDGYVLVNYPTARSRGLALAQQARQGFGAG